MLILETFDSETLILQQWIRISKFEDLRQVWDERLPGKFEILVNIVPSVGDKEGDLDQVFIKRFASHRERS